jgi:hypothetical protein
MHEKLAVDPLMLLSIYGPLRTEFILFSRLCLLNLRKSLDRLLDLVHKTWRRVLHIKGAIGYRKLHHALHLNDDRDISAVLFVEYNSSEYCLF